MYISCKRVFAQSRTTRQTNRWPGLNSPTSYSQYQENRSGKPSSGRFLGIRPLFSILSKLQDTSLSHDAMSGLRIAQRELCIHVKSSLPATWPAWASRSGLVRIRTCCNWGGRVGGRQQPKYLVQMMPIQTTARLLLRGAEPSKNKVAAV